MDGSSLHTGSLSVGSGPGAALFHSHCCAPKPCCLGVPQQLAWSSIFPSCLFSPLLKCLFSSEHLVIPSGPRPHRAALCLCAVPCSRGRFTEMEPCVCGLLKLALFTEEPVTLCLFQANLLFVFLRYLPDACFQIYVFVRSAESRTQSLEHVARTFYRRVSPLLQL